VNDAADSPVKTGRVRPLLVVVALALWLWSTFAHEFGTSLASGFFTWAQEPGALTASGGMPGMKRAEALIGAVLLLAALTVSGLTAWRLRGMPRAAVAVRLLPWVTWGVFVLLLWRTVIVYGSELVHFGQYGLIGAVLCAAIDRGRRPQIALLIATGLGVLDEAWQHWGLALALDGNLRHGFDWSDLILNATGACGGVLVFATRRGEGDRPVDDRFVLWTAGVLAALLLPLLLLDHVTLSRLFGFYRYHPYWNEYMNGKPVHWLPPGEGIPLFVAATLFLGLLPSRARSVKSHAIGLATIVLFVMAIEPPVRGRGRPVHEVVPTIRAQRVAPGAIVVDGALDEPECQSAERVGPFLHNATRSTALVLEDGTSIPLAPTHARMLWDDEALYLAFEVTDSDVWARDTHRDDPTLPGDEVVELFIDPDGDEITYYEFEFSPRNVHYDLFNFIPHSPMDYHPWAAFVGFADWNPRGVESAVAVDGTLDTVDSWESAGPIDEDRGWTVEIRIPWDVFRTTTTPAAKTHMTLPPVPGQRWRAGLYRVERPRVSPEDGAPIPRGDANPLTQLQAWSPTHLDSFHIPERFGVLEFVDER
jgi:hypothetical protein